MIVFDTYAWIEYFLDSEKADKVESYLANDEVITPLLVLLELSVKAEKEGWDIKKHIEFIKTKSTICNLTEDIIVDTGKTYSNMRKKVKDFGLIDATILTTALLNKCNLLTGDEHFKNLQQVIFLD